MLCIALLLLLTACGGEQKEPSAEGGVADQTDGSSYSIAGEEGEREGDTGSALLPAQATEELEPVGQNLIISDWEPMRLLIPAIDLDLPVETDSRYYDRDLLGRDPQVIPLEDYHSWINGLVRLLHHGPVFYSFSDLPGSAAANTVIAGHSPRPWRFFYDLDLLEAGDEVILDFAGYRFVYHKEWSEVVDEFEWGYFFATDYPALTFQTCYPKDAEGPHYPYRLIVRAALEGVYRLP